MVCLNLLKVDSWSEETLISNPNLLWSSVLQNPRSWVRLPPSPPPGSGTGSERNGKQLQIFTMPKDVKIVYSMEYNNVYTENWKLRVHPWRESLFAITADEVNLHS